MKVTPHVVFNCCTEPILGAEPQLIIWRRGPIEAFLLIFAINLTSFDVAEVGVEDLVADKTTFTPGAHWSLLVLRWVMLLLWVKINLNELWKRKKNRSFEWFMEIWLDVSACVLCMDYNSMQRIVVWMQPTNQSHTLLIDLSHQSVQLSNMIIVVEKRLWN